MRFPFDWSRLQPRPGRLDDDWREFYGGVLDAGAALGLDVWAWLFEGVQPSWFDDDGGFADERAAGRWWPAWIESAAELFGDRVAGLGAIDDPVGKLSGPVGRRPARHQAMVHHRFDAWRDAWRILRGGPPVATSLRCGMGRPRITPCLPRGRAVQDRLRWRVWMRSLRDGTCAIPNGPSAPSPTSPDRSTCPVSRRRRSRRRERVDESPSTMGRPHRRDPAPSSRRGTESTDRDHGARARGQDLDERRVRGLGVRSATRTRSRTESTSRRLRIARDRRAGRTRRRDRPRPTAHVVRRSWSGPYRLKGQLSCGRGTSPGSRGVLVEPFAEVQALEHELHRRWPARP